MTINRIETEENVYLTVDGCPFCRETFTEVIDGKITSKVRWFFKQRPDEVEPGIRYSHWTPCSEEESTEFEKNYKKTIA